MTAPNVIAGAEIPVSDVQGATFHAATDFKGMTVGLSGSVANPAALNYVIAPNASTILETDLKDYTLHLYNKVRNKINTRFCHPITNSFHRTFEIKKKTFQPP